MPRGAREISVFCLNMVQGLPASFFAIGLPAVLREGGAGLDFVSLAYLMWAPWALKWLWGPLLDGRPNAFNAVFGRTVHLPVVMAAAFVLLVAFPPTGFAWPIFAVGIFCSFVGATLQMVLARWIMLVEPLEKRRARLNAMQVAGMITGAMVGGTLMVALSELMSWTIAVLVIGGLILLAGLPFALTQPADTASPPGETRVTPGTLSVVLTAWSFFKRPGIGALVGLMLLSDIATGVDLLLTAVLIDGGFSATRATFLLNTLALAITIPASFLIGRILQRFPTTRVLAVLLAVKGAIFLLLAIGGVANAGLSATLCIAAIVVASLIAVAYWQVYMRLATSDLAASDIGMLTSIRTLFLMIGGIGAGQVSSLLGYPGIFGVAGVMALAAAVVASLSAGVSRERVTP